VADDAEALDERFGGSGWAGRYFLVFAGDLMERVAAMLK